MILNIYKDLNPFDFVLISKETGECYWSTSIDDCAIRVSDYFESKEAAESELRIYTKYFL